jgi:hypothetical protein
MRLSQVVDEYMSTLRPNPPQTTDEVVDGLCVHIKADAGDISAWDEFEWLEALAKMGVPDELLASKMEDVATWGVDDGEVSP